MAFTEQPPPVPPANVALGEATVSIGGKSVSIRITISAAWLQWLQALTQYLKRMGASIP